MPFNQKSIKFGYTPPLVSVVVVTYNSSKYVIDTLESIKAQTYHDLEIIVTDDCSTDDTVEICRKWLEENKKRFIKTDLIEGERNRGTSVNGNKGAKLTNGQWIKFIGGDDLLAKNYFETLLLYVSQEKCKINVLCSNHYVFQDFDKTQSHKTRFENTLFFKEAITANEQFQIALRCVGTVPTFTVLLTKTIFDQVGGFDEHYKYVEDYPFFLKINQFNEKIYLVTEALAYYRRHDCNITRRYNMIISPVFKEVLDVKFNYCKRYLPNIEKIGVFHEYFASKITIFFEQKIIKLAIIWRFFYQFQRYFNPLFLYRNLLKIFGKEYKFQKFLSNAIEQKLD